MNIKPLFAAGVLALTCGADSVTAAPTNTIQVSAKNLMFSPATITVKAGATVTWLNLDEEPHTVFSSTGLFRSSALDTQESFSFTFDKPGTYRYLCTIHPQMLGTIVVE